jgi:hemolysin activation/secretion protein
MTLRTALLKLACGALVGIAAPVPAQTAPSTPESRVRVDTFVVTGNTLLPQAAIDAALARFKGERTLAELQQAALAVQALYRDAGYGSVVAYVPPQTGAPGSATIAVLEGRVSRVVISGNSRFSDANIRRAVPQLREGETPQVRRIAAQIQLANENPARQIALALEPGAQPGDVEARVTVTEMPTSRWSFALDNSGNENTGRLRASIGFQNSALWDRDHQFSLQVLVAPDELRAVGVVSAGYRIPLYGAGLTLDLLAAHSDVKGGTAATPAGPLQFSGKGDVLGLKLGRRLERRGDIDQQLSVGLDRRVYRNDCSILGLPPGACGAAGASVAVHPLSLDYQWQSVGKVPFGFNLGYSHNLDLGGSHASPADYDAIRPGAVVSYNVVRFGAFGSLPLPRAWLLQGRIGGQWTGDALVPGEQFGIAGALAVRGYEEREIAGDRGALASIELLTPNLLGAKDRPQAALRLLGFVDAGQAANHLDTPCRASQSSCSLASVGFGARLGYGGLQLKADVAHALKDGIRTLKGDNRIHFQAIYSLP